MQVRNIHGPSFQKPSFCLFVIVVCTVSDYSTVINRIIISRFQNL